MVNPGDSSPGMSAAAFVRARPVGTRDRPTVCGRRHDVVPGTRMARARAPRRRRVRPPGDRRQARAPGGRGRRPGPSCDTAVARARRRRPGRRQRRRLAVRSSMRCDAHRRGGSRRSGSAPGRGRRHSRLTTCYGSTARTRPLVTTARSCSCTTCCGSSRTCASSIPACSRPRRTNSASTKSSASPARTRDDPRRFSKYRSPTLRPYVPRRRRDHRYDARR